jgi:serine protease DegS
VVAKADEIKAHLHDGRELRATIIGTDLPRASLGQSDTLQVGDVVMAIGNPFGVGQTVTLGIVSATGRNQLGITDFENFIQTDAAINPGNSGGALINAAGEVIGINTAIFSQSGGSHGIGFAVPIQLAAEVMQQIVEHGRVIRGWLGITGQNLTAELAESLEIEFRDGILVSGVLEKGPAGEAGLQPGDVIVRLGRETIADSQQMLKAISSKRPGSPLAITLYRKDRPLEFIAVVGERPPEGER